MPRYNSSYSGMQHLNGHLLCAVDVETTGLIAGFHDLIQVAVLPLDAEIKPIKTVNPFYLNIRPKFPENINYEASRVNKLRVADLMKNGMDADDAADLFVEWFENLNLPLTTTSCKKIMPLWSNGSFDKSFLVEWLGQDCYDSCFHFHERDTQSLALYINDRHDFFNERVPFGRVGLNNLASYLKIKNDKPHDALQDALTTANVYRELVNMHLPVVPQ